jgi:hypothetical protein
MFREKTATIIDGYQEKLNSKTLYGETGNKFQLEIYEHVEIQLQIYEHVEIHLI